MNIGFNIYTRLKYTSFYCLIRNVMIEQYSSTFCEENLIISAAHLTQIMVINIEVQVKDIFGEQIHRYLHSRIRPRNLVGQFRDLEGLLSGRGRLIIVYYLQLIEFSFCDVVDEAVNFKSSIGHGI